jgi:hypothetical protein
MKAVVITLLMLITCSVLPAQDVREMKLPWKAGQKVILNLKFGRHVSIEAWDKKEVFLKAEISINGGELNEAHIMDSILTDQSLTIDADLDENLVGKSFCCNCDENGSSRYTINKKGRCKSICTEIDYTVYVPAGADLELETITGDVKIVNMKGAIDAKSVSGTVDAIIPGSQQVDVKLESVMGRVSSNPDITTLVDGLRPMLARKLKGKLNGGGKNVNLESVTGDVSLRAQ